MLMLLCFSFFSRVMSISQPRGKNYPYKCASLPEVIIISGVYSFLPMPYE
jgi:hypothetical protein